MSAKSGFTKPSSSYSTSFQPSCFPKIRKEIKTFVSLQYLVTGRNPFFFFCLKMEQIIFIIILFKGVPDFFLEGKQIKKI